MRIILYTIDCPKCKVLEKKLDKKGIEYEKVTNEEYLRELGLDTFPVIEFPNGTRYEFTDANDWINNYTSGDDFY